LIVGAQRTLVDLYEQVERGYSELGGVMKHWEDLDETVRRAIARDCASIRRHLSLSSDPALPSSA
jgi:hypothetical protein